MAATPAAEEPTEVSPEAVLNTALSTFAALGYSDSKLETIAKESGMSKRMIHYHFGDKGGLYHRCLEKAVNNLRPTEAEIQLESAVPVDSVRKVVEAIVRCYVDNPDSVRMLLMENLHRWGEVDVSTPLDDKSAVILQLDKLLMQGQDSGVFRPGISAMDVFTLIVSLAIFRVSNRDIMINLYGMDPMDEDNTEGMARMATDAVLAFLTSTIDSADTVSYLKASRVDTAQDVEEDGAYDISASVFDH